MPGANCSIFGCNVSRSKSGIAIFKIPSGDDDYNTKWREKLIHIITKDRVIDHALKKQITDRKLHVCEKHFPQSCVNYHATKTTLIPGSIPTLLLPEKSIPSSSTITKSRSSAESISLKRSSLPVPEITHVVSYYKDFAEFQKRIMLVKLPASWHIVPDTNNIKIFNQDASHALPYIEVFVDTDLQFTVRVFMWKLPDDHEIYVKNSRTVRNITLSNLIHILTSYGLCTGISDVDAVKTTFIKHCIPQITNPLFETDNLSFLPICQTVFNRCSGCQILVYSSKCENCVMSEKKEAKLVKRKSENIKTPAKLKHPFHLHLLKESN